MESQSEEEDDEDDEEEANISLAAMEAELKPQVLETFDRIAKTYKSLRKLQDQEVAEKTKLSPSQTRRYKKLREELIEDVKSLSLNAARIEALVEQLYDINKRLISLEGRLMRLAETYKVPRAVFLEEYRGGELDPNWTRRVGRLSKHGWKEFVSKEKGDHQGSAQRDSRPGLRYRTPNPGISPHCPYGAERRARGASGQEGNGRGQPAPGDLDRQEIHQPRPAVPRPYSRRQHRS